MAQPVGKFPGRRTFEPATRPARPYRLHREPGGGSSPSLQWSSSLNVLLGLWLVIAPWALNFSDQNNAVWNHVVVGVAIAMIGLVRMSAPTNWAPLSLLNVVLGGWMIAAPFIMTFDTVADTAAIYWNDALVGAAVVILALIGSNAGARQRPDAPARS